MVNHVNDVLIRRNEKVSQLFRYQLCYEKYELFLGIVQSSHPISKGETVIVTNEVLQNLKAKKKLLNDSNKFTVHSVHHFLVSGEQEPELPILFIKLCTDV